MSCSCTREAALAMLAAGLGLAAPASAADLAPALGHGTVSIQVENDIVADTDRHYTNGIRISYLSAADAVPAPIRDAARVMPFLADGDRWRYGVHVGQNMFTPENIASPVPDPNDRPYAGWLYGGISVISDTGARLDRLALDVGIVGPPSLAAETQRFVHDLIDAQDPKGWGFQLDTEPGVVLTYERAWRNVVEVPVWLLGVDATPHIGAAVGNVFTYGAAGLTVRVGRDLPSDYGPPRIRPALPGAEFFDPRDRWGWYLFAGVEGRVVGRNIFLDGNTLADSPSVDKENVVADLQMGIAVTVWGTRVAYTHVLRTHEFESQRAGDNFGSLSVSVRF